MKFISLLSVALFSLEIYATRDFGYLKPEDQPHYKNEAMTGMNQMERIDSTVKEINKLHGEIIQLKKEVALLRSELDQLKSEAKK